jgi:hypothetical protein
MNGSANRAGNAMTAVVARQFAPSRLERELLVRVFELVCGLGSMAKDSDLAASGTGHTYGIGVVEESLHTQTEGRRAA